MAEALMRNATLSDNLDELTEIIFPYIHEERAYQDIKWRRAHARGIAQKIIAAGWRLGEDESN